MNLKHFSSLGMVAAIAGLAAVSVVAAEVTDEIASECIAGVVKVIPPTKLNEKVLIAIPWIGGFDGSKQDVAITVSNLVKTANLSQGDQLQWYDKSVGKYQVWSLDENKQWAKQKMVSMDASGGSESEESPAPDVKQLARGDAVLLWRKHNADWGNPIYLNGLVSTNSVTFNFGNDAGLSLFAPPSVTGAVDFAAATWNGQSVDDEVIFIDAAGVRRSFKWQMNKKTKVEKWNGAGQTVVPRGYGVWFKRKKPGENDVTVAW